VLEENELDFIDLGDTDAEVVTEIMLDEDLVEPLGVAEVAERCVDEL
jgi:hypothetical protein